jgi:hypothetical protein
VEEVTLKRRTTLTVRCEKSNRDPDNKLLQWKTKKPLQVLRVNFSPQFVLIPLLDDQ